MSSGYTCRIMIQYGCSQLPITLSQRDPHGKVVRK